MKSVRVFFAFALIGSAVLFSGCETLMGPSQTQLRQQAEIDRLQSDVLRLRGQVDELIVSQERVFADISEVRASQIAMQSDVQGGIRELQSTVHAEATARETMRGEIIDHLGQKVTKILDQQAAATPAPRTERGYEHIVKEGETLSEIAKVYGARVDDVVKLNNLSSANMIRIGQKLFIPAR